MTQSGPDYPKKRQEWLKMLSPHFASTANAVADNNALHKAVLASFPADPNAFTAANPALIEQPASGNTPLQLAIKRGDVKAAEAMLTRLSKEDASTFRSSVNNSDSRGLTALHWACMLRMNTVIDMLLDLGAETKIAYMPKVGMADWNKLVWATKTAKSGDALRTDSRFYPVSPLDLYDTSMLNRAPEAAPYEEKKECAPWIWMPSKHEAFSDIVFYISLICQDERFKDIEFTFFKDNDPTTTPIGNESLFKSLWSDFCTARDALPAAPDLMAKLNDASRLPQEQWETIMGEALREALREAANPQGPGSERKPP